MLQQSPLYSYIPAKDLARSREFYEKRLGFSPKEEIAGGVVYEFAKGTSCFLYVTPNAGTSKASQAFWQVANIEREVTELRERGIVFDKFEELPGERSMDGIIVKDGGAKAAWFRDPDGNILAIIQYVGAE
jgi:catechol 2,3-dioxygenase-like lactoylglutathione lyase family enzyme